MRTFRGNRIGKGVGNLFVDATADGSTSKLFDAAQREGRAGRVLADPASGVGSRPPGSRPPGSGLAVKHPGDRPVGRRPG
jgi:hypothetical protein